MQFKGHYVTGEKFQGDNAEQLAWDSMLEKLVGVVRMCDTSSRFIWRLTPRMVFDRDWDSAQTVYVASGRLIEVIGEGELPHPRVALIDSMRTGFGFGLEEAQAKELAP